MPDDHLEQVFDPYFTTHGKNGAIGFGLSTAYGIVTNHGGRIEIESEVGKGTMVIIQLPKATEAAAHEPSETDTGTATDNDGAASEAERVAS